MLRKLQSIEPVTHLGRLRKLEVFGCRKVADVDLLSRNAALEVLDLAGVHIRDAAFIGQLSRLTRLSFETIGSIPSIQFITRLRQLEDVHLTDTKVVDGDMSPFLELPKLKRALFKRFRHSTHASDAINASLRARD